MVGHSLGGMIGPAYARAYPDRVISLGLLSTAAFRTEDDSAKVKGVVAAMEEKGIPQVLDTLADRWFTDRFMAGAARAHRGAQAPGRRDRPGRLPQRLPHLRGDRDGAVAARGEGALASF